MTADFHAIVLTIVIVFLFLFNSTLLKLLSELQLYCDCDLQIRCSRGVIFVIDVFMHKVIVTVFEKFEVVFVIVIKQYMCNCFHSTRSQFPSNFAVPRPAPISQKLRMSRNGHLLHSRHNKLNNVLLVVTFYFSNTFVYLYCVFLLTLKK